ncbi:TPA: hypothetical protein RUX96_000794 [Aeromonas dhakensis]|nr:hypothetical protein [Aeromonas dhakensis]
MYPNCFDENIKSHAISRSISLQSIAEEFHVKAFVPRQNSKTTKEPMFQSVSINRATREHCFCDKHDNFFESLDNREIQSAKDVLLQVYRSLCVAMNEEKKAAKNLMGLNDLGSYKNIGEEAAIRFLSDNGHECLIQHIKDPEVLAIVQKKMMFLASENIDKEAFEIESLAMKIKSCYDSIDECLLIGVNKPLVMHYELVEYSIICYKVDFQIPVALNSIQHGVFGMKKTRVYSMVIPYATSTVVIGLFPNVLLNSVDGLVDRIDDYFSSSYKIIKYIESVMSTADGWYIKPSIIDTMPKEKAEFFSTDCMFLNERKLLQDYDLSIFDELKMAHCGLKCDNPELVSIPTRPDYDIRYQEMLQVMGIAAQSKV